MARVDRRGAPGARPRPRPLPARPADRPRAPLGRLAAVQGEHGLRQHDPRFAREALPGRPRDRTAHRVADPLERGRDGGAREPRELRVRRPHRDLCVVGDALRSRLQPFLARALRASPRRHDLCPGAFEPGHLRARLPRGPLDGRAVAALPPGGGWQGAPVVPAPVADARFLAVPDGLHGPGSAAGDHAGALRALPREPRPRRALRPEGLVLPGRRRDGRAGVDGRADHAGAREARQPRLRHQLQPAAARRPGARQRQDHPGTRGRLPRRGLERDQGDLGLSLGPAARAGHLGPAAPAHGRGGRWRIPEFQGQGRRLHARAFLRQVPGAAGTRREHVRRRDRAPEPRRPRLAQGLERLRRRDDAQGTADRDPRQDRQRLRHGQGGRGAERHAPAEEDGRGGAEGVPRPLQHPDLRRRDRARAVPPARRRHARNAVPEDAPQGARRLAARAAHECAAARDPGARGVQEPARRHRGPRDFDHDGFRADPHAAPQGQEHRPARRADRAGRGADLRHGGPVPAGRHLFSRSASCTRRRMPTS